MERAYSGMDRGIHHHSIDNDIGHDDPWYRTICGDDTGDSYGMYWGRSNCNMPGGYIWKEK